MRYDAYYPLIQVFTKTSDGTIKRGTQRQAGGASLLTEIANPSLYTNCAELIRRRFSF